MCVEIEIGDAVVDVVSDLRSLMPQGLVLDDDTYAIPEDACLCNVKLEATAALNGFKAIEEGSMYYVFLPIGALN